MLYENFKHFEIKQLKLQLYDLTFDSEFLRQNKFVKKF